MVDFFNPSITSRLLNSITRNQSGLQNSISKVASGKRLINASALEFSGSACRWRPRVA